MGARSARRDSAFAVILRRTLVLLVRTHGRDRLLRPGGGLKRRETARAAALREVEEETGLRARLLGRTGEYRRSDGSLAIVFAARVAWDAEPAGPRFEIREQRWVEGRKALRLLPRKSRQRLAEALAAPLAFGARSARCRRPAPALPAR